MSYTINSAKDSHGDEQLYMELFNQRRAEIEQYKQTHGGDLEGAFQAVTGKPWPSGRSVKIHNGVPEMTKDRTVKSVLGKYVAPIGAAAAMAFVPGLAPALGHAFGLGGGAAPAAGIGETGAITGLSGSGFGAAAGVPAFGPMAGGYAGLGTAGATSATVPSSLAAGGSSILGKAGGYLKNLVGGETGGTPDGAPGTDGFTDLASLFGKYGDAEANNRATTGNFTQSHDKLMLDAQQENRAQETDALKKLAQTGYISSGGSQFNPANVKLNSGSMPDFGFGPKPSTDDQKTGASTLTAQLLKRLAPGGSYTPAPLESYTKPGIGEKVGNYGSLITGGIGAARKLFGF